MLVCLACTFFKIYDFFLQVYSICNLIFSDSSLFLYSATVNDSLEMAFAEKKVRFYILEHPEILQNLDFCSHTHNIKPTLGCSCLGLRYWLNNH